MHATAIVPVKRFGAAKQRLGDALAPRARAELAAAMLTDVLAAIARSAAIERALVVSGEPRAAAIATEYRTELLADPDDSGHSAAAAAGVAVAAGHGAVAVALLPGDCPLLDPGELDAALATLDPPAVGVVPDRHGTGTNALLLAPPDAIDPAFGAGSHERHLSLARAAGVPARTVELPSLALDLDTVGDLEALRAVAARSPSACPATATALERVAPGRTS